MLESPTLADLSRAASVISTSSEDSVLPDPPRRVRTFSSPRSASPRAVNSRIPQAPAYLSRELQDNPESEASQLAKARARSQSRKRTPTADDFVFGATLGEGSYSVVMRATHASTGHQYAMKIMDKRHLIRKQKTGTANAERMALMRLGSTHPGIVKLAYTFQDEYSLYFALELVKNGEMQTRISQMGSLSTACTQYYGAQIVDALAFMHSKGVIHRDLKPENLLLDSEFRIKITDFGTGKILEPSMERANTFVGTSQYVSPELLEATETSRSTDIWALGCIIYQMISGSFAFQGLSDYLTWQKIKKLEYTFPDGFDDQAKDLVNRILVREPTQRLGAGAVGSPNDMQALKSHPFFSSIHWATLWTIPAPALEPGLVVRAKPNNASQSQWEDFGASWDAMVANDNPDIEWASDGEGPEFELARRNGIANSVKSNGHANEVGPMGETPPRRLRRSPTREGYSRGITPVGPRDRCESNSSEDSATTKLGDTLNQLSFPSSDVDADAQSISESMRGRNRVLTPIQGNSFDVTPFLITGEAVVYQSTVEARSLRRRASRLLASLPVPPVKIKSRQLVLTNLRLLCLKQHRKNPGTLGIKIELGLRASENVRAKKVESRSIITCVEAKGEREFVVITSTKSYTYATGDPASATIWLTEIANALRA